MKELNTPLLIEEINDKINTAVAEIKKADQKYTFAGECVVNKPTGLTSSAIHKHTWLKNPPAIPDEDILSVESLALPEKIYKNDKIDIMSIYTSVLMIAEALSHVHKFHCQWYHETDGKMVLIDEISGTGIFAEKLSVLPKYITGTNEIKVSGWERTCNGQPIDALPQDINVECTATRDMLIKNNDFSRLIRNINSKLNVSNGKVIEYKFYTGRLWSKLK